MARRGECKITPLSVSSTVQMNPNKDETAVHGCHCPRDMAVRMREVLAIPLILCARLQC